MIPPELFVSPSSLSFFASLLHNDRPDLPKDIMIRMLLRLYNPLSEHHYHGLTGIGQDHADISECHRRMPETLHYSRRPRAANERLSGFVFKYISRLFAEIEAKSRICVFFAERRRVESRRCIGRTSLFASASASDSASCSRDLAGRVCSQLRIDSGIIFY
jgi:hypothetical protein